MKNTLRWKLADGLNDAMPYRSEMTNKEITKKILGHSGDSQQASTWSVLEAAVKQGRVEYGLHKKRLAKTYVRVSPIDPVSICDTLAKENKAYLARRKAEPKIVDSDWFEEEPVEEKPIFKGGETLTDAMNYIQIGREALNEAEKIIQGIKTSLA